MDFEKWHDGTGYDVDLLRQMSPAERAAAETALIAHRPRDWRDIEALAVIDSPAARAEVESALNSPDAAVRREAMAHASAKVDPQRRERLLVSAIGHDDLGRGLSGTLDEVAEFHPPAVIDALFCAALRRHGEVAVHFAAMLFFLHGRANEPFDWAHRPFFLRFASADPLERKAAFIELCEAVGVDPARYLGDVGHRQS